MLSQLKQQKLQIFQRLQLRRQLQLQQPRQLRQRLARRVQEPQLQRQVRQRQLRLQLQRVQLHRQRQPRPPRRLLPQRPLRQLLRQQVLQPLQLQVRNPFKLLLYLCFQQRHKFLKKALVTPTRVRMAVAALKLAQSKILKFKNSTEPNLFTPIATFAKRNSLRNVMKF